jgi:hypothetical protein
MHKFIFDRNKNGKYFWDGYKPHKLASSESEAQVFCKPRYSYKLSLNCSTFPNKDNGELELFINIQIHRSSNGKSLNENQSIDLELCSTFLKFDSKINYN